jgi:hypothetical protein
VWGQSIYPAVALVAGRRLKESPLSPFAIFRTLIAPEHWVPCACSVSLVNAVLLQSSLLGWLHHQIWLVRSLTKFEKDWSEEACSERLEQPVEGLAVSRHSDAEIYAAALCLNDRCRKDLALLH